ncbi:MAG: helix-turn-helix domain-containing protein [Dongiaceae bacterium]
MLSRPVSSGLADRLRRINQIASLVNTSADPKDVVDRIALAVCQQSPWSTSAIMAVEPDAGYSVLITRHDPFVVTRRPLSDRWPLDGSPTRTVLATGKPMVIPDALESEYPGYREEARACDYRTVVLLPLAASPGGRGLVMSVHAQDKVEVDEDELRFLETVANLAALAIARVEHLDTERNLTRRLEHVLDVYSMLMNRVMADVSLESTAQLAEKLLGCPVILVDLVGNRIAGGSPPPDSELSQAEWQEIVSVRSRRRLCQVARDGGMGEGNIVAFSLENVRPGLVLRIHMELIVVDHRTVGGLFLLPGARRFDNIDMLIVEALRFAIGVQLMRLLVRVGDEAEALNDFFGRLFDRGWKSPAEIGARAGRLGVAVDMPGRLLTLALPDRIAEADRPKLLEATQRALARMLSDADQRGIAAIHEGDVVLLWTSDAMPGAEPPAEPPADLLTRLQHEAEWSIGARAILHVGRLCATPQEFRTARADAQYVVALARRVGRSGRIGDEDFDPVAKMMATADPAAIDAFVAARIGAIERHDREHETGFLETLRVVIDAGQRPQSAADRLGLHVSTLRYRLQRLSDLFGVDPNDPAQRFALDLALRLREGPLSLSDDGSYDSQE